MLEGGGGAACRAVTKVVDIPVDLARTIGLEFQSPRTTKSPAGLRGRRVHRGWNLEHVSRAAYWTLVQQVAAASGLRDDDSPTPPANRTRSATEPARIFSMTQPRWTLTGHALVDLRDDVRKFAHRKTPSSRSTRAGMSISTTSKGTRGQSSRLTEIAAKKTSTPECGRCNSLSKTISRLGLLAIPLVLVNQDLSRDDTWFGRPPRDDCCRERLALENRLIALCTGPLLTHVLPLRNQPILRPPRGRSVGCRGDSEGGSGQRGGDAGGRSGCIRRR